MSDITNLAEEALVSMTSSAVDKAGVDVHELGLIDKIWDTGIEDEIAAGISTLARLKVLEVALLSAIIAGGIDKTTARDVKRNIMSAVLQQNIANSLLSRQDAVELYPEIKLAKPKTSTSPNLAEAAQGLQESLIIIEKQKHR